MTPDCLHIVLNSVIKDSRVLKETKSISESGLVNELSIAGLKEEGLPASERIDQRSIYRVDVKTYDWPQSIVVRPLKYAELHFRMIRAYRAAPLRIIHCHDLNPLPVSVRLKKLTGAKLIYDSHELQSETKRSKGVQKAINRKLERYLLRYVDDMITVSPSILKWYAHRHPGIPIHLVRNIPEVPERSHEPKRLRQKLNVPDDSLLFIYLGGLDDGRGIEIALQAFSDDRVKHHVVFMGYGPLAQLVAAAAQRCPRIHYHGAVPPSEVLLYARGADVGLSLIEDICLSYRYSLPNKLFEALLAGLPVLVSPVPEQATLVREREAGWVVENEPKEIAKFLIALKASEARTLRQSLGGRVIDLCWSNEAKILIEVYRKLLREPRP